MNSVRFYLVDFIDWSINKLSKITSPCRIAFRSFFKDTKRRLQLFTFLNLVICTFKVIFFCIPHSGGIVRPTHNEVYWAFLTGMIIEWISAGILLWAQRKRSALKCQVWCLLEICLVVGLLILTLSELLHIHWIGLLILALFTSMKLHGVWIIYYFSLECSSNNFYDDCKEESVVKYFSNSKKPPPVRRNTDQTSVSSTPNSPRRMDSLDMESDQCDESNRDSFASSPPSPVLSFFSRLALVTDFDCQPHYSEVMVSKPKPMSSHASNQVDHIIVSELMCGGSSTINTSNVQ